MPIGLISDMRNVLHALNVTRQALNSIIARNTCNNEHSLGQSHTWLLVTFHKMLAIFFQQSGDSSAFEHLAHEHETLEH